MLEAPSSNGVQNKTGLKIDRVFSNPNVRPFDEIAWAERTAEIKDESGRSIFHQSGCEFPESWSQLAVNIVASKYFYGDIANGNGSPADGRREYSVKQLVGRVAKTIADWGDADGYFDTRADADSFEDELTWLLVNQHAAFNSPVWFNVGLWGAYQIEGTYDGFYYDRREGRAAPVKDGEAYRHPAGSACFILGAGDSIPEIYERAAIEGRIFKYGSGCGSNNSSIRSSREVVRGGGKPSGPLSFMTVYDAVAKVTKSGGKTRRAAKMEILDDWHPDILEFIRCKGVEEAKAHALIREGYESNFNGEAYTTVCFQNSNMSVRFSDAFMAKVDGFDEDANWQTRAVTTGTEFNTRGERMPAYDANELFNEVASGTWHCGDPGVHFSDTINLWHTCKATDQIHACNPCSEYLFLDNSACNLASLNLLKFVKPDGLFDVARFKAAVRILFTAQEILVDRCGYPTEKICQNSHDFRPLGLGYCNLGALLMTRGLAYDSDEGRAYAAAITAIMHGEANLTSIRLAEVQGPFSGYELNRESFLSVMDMHYEYACHIHEESPEIRSLKEEAVALWRRVSHRGKMSGFRNAQATLLAPTGTIAFMMDCDTTGIEPDIALLKYKQLAGGGVLKIVNQSIRPALRNLGYTNNPIYAIDGDPDSGTLAKDEIEDAVAWIEDRGCFDDYPLINTEHRPVFDCAFPAKQGGRSIAWKGHVDMMAAVQPFLSGAISKTCNVPESSTVDDIRNAYIYAWKKGLKCVAIYRDGSKSSQPLNTKSESKQADPAPAPVAPEATAPRRERLPATRRAVTHKFEIQGHEGYVNVGFYPDGRPGELFVTMAKEGSTIGGLMDAWATAISIGLQYGVPLDVLVEKFAHSRFEPSGFTRNPDIPIAKSLTDYIARWMGMECVSGYREENAPKREPLEVSADWSDEPARDATPRNQAAQYQTDAPACSNCGAITRRAGSCYLCETCGSSSGCG